MGKTGELLGHNLFIYCKNNPVNAFEPSGFREIRGAFRIDGDFDGMDLVPRRDTDYVELAGPPDTNLAGAILGTATGVVGSLEKEAAGYVDKDSIIHFYPSSGIAQKIKPYANISKRVARAFTVVTTAFDVAHTWDPNVKLSLGQRIGKTALQLAGVGAGIAVGAFISGPLLASGITLGGGAAFVGVIGAFAIDLATGAAIRYGQNAVYRRYGME